MKLKVLYNDQVVDYRVFWGGYFFLLFLFLFFFFVFLFFGFFFAVSVNSCLKISFEPLSADDLDCINERKQRRCDFLKTNRQVALQTKHPAKMLKLSTIIAFISTTSQIKLL